MLVTIPLFVIPGMLLIPLPYSIRYGFITQWATLIIWVLRIVCRIDFSVSGQENIPSSNAIIFSKHQSTWETIALQRIFPPQLWVIKQELLWVPFFGWALWMLESIPIDRSSGRKAVNQIVEIGKQRLDKGRWVVIFPEGTRAAPGTKKRYGVGGAILAAKSGYPVVPVAHNAGEHWGKRSFLKIPGTIKVVIGPLIESEGKTATEINQAAEDWIESTMQTISNVKIKSSDKVKPSVSS
ncbi:MAG: lysophospholipid acyltransferase family protein [Thiohalomonadales bacterium]